MRALLSTAIAMLLASVQEKVTEGASTPETALKEFKEAYVKAGKSTPARVEAVLILGKAPHLKTLNVLHQLMQGDGTGQEVMEVRIAAAEMVGSRFKEVRGAWSPVADVARRRDKKSTPLRIAAAKALTQLEAREGLKTLQDLVDDKPFELAREAVEGLGRIPDRSSVPLLIKLLREVERVPDDPILGELPFGGWGFGGVVVDDARSEQNQRREILLQPVLSALRDLTGQNLKIYKDYHRWWSAKGPSFTIPAQR
jgi:hypothetical protein